MAAVMLVRKVVLAEVVEPRMFGLVEQLLETELL
jgi:hypothetical protein